MKPETRETKVPHRNSPARSAGPDRLAGTVMMIDDSCWGFKAVGRIEHPGACVGGGDAQLMQCVFVKGSDARRYRPYARTAVIIRPTTRNGLSKETAFSLEPHIFNTHRMEHRSRARGLGRLDPADLMRLQAALDEAFPATVRA